MMHINKEMCKKIQEKKKTILDLGKIQDFNHVYK